MNEFINDTKKIEQLMEQHISLEELKVQASLARREANRLEDMVENYKYKQLEEQYGHDFRQEKCKFDAVFDLSCDGWHNKCGHRDANCTCCDCPCIYYQPDNEISLWIKENIKQDKSNACQNLNSKVDLKSMFSLLLQVFIPVNRLM